MNKRTVALVAVEKTSYHFDQLFTYLIPEHLQNELEVGCRVLIPFGKGNKKMQGMVYAIQPYQDEGIKYKPVHAVIDEDVVKLLDFADHHLYGKEKTASLDTLGTCLFEAE